LTVQKKAIFVRQLLFFSKPYFSPPKHYIGGIFLVVSGGMVVLVVSVAGGLVTGGVVTGGAIFVESIVIVSLVVEARRLELHAEVAIINEPTTARLKIVFFIGFESCLQI